jgi:hypothetical protein
MLCGQPSDLSNVRLYNGESVVGSATLDPRSSYFVAPIILSSSLLSNALSLLLVEMTNFANGIALSWSLIYLLRSHLSIRACFYGTRY